MAKGSDKAKAAKDAAPSTTPISPSFRHSVYLIPTPGADGTQRPTEWRPFIYRWWAWGYHSGIMLVLAVAVEVAVYFSIKLNGFPVREDNVFSFGGRVSSQFLLSFFPTLLIAPLSFVMNVIWFWFRVYQPYITLARGDASAKESVNMNYLSYNKFQAIWHARKNGHSLLYTTGVLSIGCLLFQPLASSFFELKDVYKAGDVQNFQSKQSLGLSVEGQTLTPYVAAAGYVTASVANNLGDPPFVDKTWTIASFEPKEKDDTAVPTYQVSTTGIQSFPNCFPADQTVLTPPIDGSITLKGSAPAGFGNGQNSGPCNANAVFATNSSTQQYGAVVVPECAVNGSTAEQQKDFQPVMFWFFNEGDGTDLKGASVFCAPQIKVSLVDANVTLSNITLVNVNITSDKLPDNNVTGGAQQGRAYNGMFFEHIADEFVQARADTIKSILPGAILRAAQLSGGVQDAFTSNLTKFSDLTNLYYRRHLAISAQGAYFTDAPADMPTVEFKIHTRLSINVPTAHTLAALLAVTGIMTIILHVKHRRARAGLHLTHTPGSIASTVALTGRSGFGEILVPYETDESIKEKLGPLRFRLDARTGAILADSDDAYGPMIGKGKRGSRMPPPPTMPIEPKSPLTQVHFAQEEEMQMSLLGPNGSHDRDRSSKVSFADQVSSDGHGSGHSTSKPGTPGGPSGLLEVPYAWEPLPELHKTGPPA